MADPVELPRTYRPLGVRIAAALATLALVSAVALLWTGMSAEVQATFTTLQRVTLLMFFAAMVALLYALFRTSATADEAGLQVVNGYRSRRLEWAQIVRISLTPNRPWALLDLDDGSTVSVMAIQSADGRRATAAARELARVIAARTRTDRDE